LKCYKGVNIGERLAGKEFGVNQKFKMAARDSFLTKKSNFGHKLSLNIFKFGENIAKYKDMPYGRRSAEMGNSK
jgi:hypothetical protein